MRLTRISVSIALILSLTRSQGSGQSSEWTVRLGGGLGVGTASMPALVDYANLVGRPATADRAQDFQVVASIAAGADVRITDAWLIGLHYERMVKTISSTPNVLGAGWEFETTVSMPTLMVKHVLIQGGATVEAGAGVGYYSGTLLQRYVPASAEESFEGKGPGVLVEISARMPLDEHFFAGLTGLLQWSRINTIKSDTGRLPAYSGQTADLAFFRIGIQFALTYQF